MTGWFSWIGDALHLVFAFGAMAWTIGIVGWPHLFSLPIQLFMVPLMVFFVCKALMGPLLYMRRVKCSLQDVLGSALAGMALSHGIAQGVFAGLWNKTAVFEITEKGATDKGGAADKVAVDPAPADAAQASAGNADIAPADAAKASKAVKAPAGPAWGGVREEAMLLIALLSCVGAMAWTRLPNHLESAMWMTILILQAVPYMASVVCAGLSALPEFQPRRRRQHSLRPAAASAAPGLLATARAISGVDEGPGGRTPSKA